jgi:hypothetical protein
MLEKVLLIVFVVNVILSAVAGALHALVAKFPGLAKADSIIGKIVSVVAKLVDLASANVAHKPVIAAVEVKKD